MARVRALTADIAGGRLDRFISEKVPAISRTYAQKLIAGGSITVNGLGAKASLKLNPGDRVNIVIPPTPASPLSPEAMPLNIIYEDNDLLVIDKPAGLTVHPAPGQSHHTLVNAVLSHFPDLAAVSDSLRPGIVHRLD